MRKLLSLLVIGFLLFFNFSLLKSSYESAMKLGSVSQEEEKVRELEKINLNLKEELKRRDSSLFIEQEARNRLGLGKPGETAIIVEEAGISKAQKQDQQAKTNFQKWVELFRI